MKLFMKPLRQLLMKKKNLELKKSIRMMNSQRSDAEKVSLIEEGKKEVLTKLLSVMKLLISV